MTDGSTANPSASNRSATYTLAEVAEIVRADYSHFPQDQTYEIYDRDVYFQDPLTSFRGIKNYRQNIEFIARWFQDIDLQLHTLDVKEDRIETSWTLSWTTPLPWQPRIAIPGWSELVVNKSGAVVSHIDRWNCSRWDVLKQHFSLP